MISTRRSTLLLVAVASLALMGAGGAAGQTPPPVPDVIDAPDDAGTALNITWTNPADATLSALVERRDANGHRDTLDAVPAIDPATLERGTTTVRDDGLTAGAAYEYRMAWVSATDTVWSGWTPPVAPRLQWFNGTRLSVGVATLIFGIVLVAFVISARRGASLFIRRIAGLEAVEEAVGRATEMGRPILYCTGLDPMDEVATVASVNILGQVAKKAAEYETRLVVPHRDPIVMAVCQEVVREAHNEVGRPDTYRPDDIYYTTYSQFGYAAAICGFMMRERPATNLFIGRFYAESLILAETGNATGAIQIAGTDADAQLPFFITSCDYTLIGEELYAGSVYLSREPLLLGALKGQDAAKALIILVLIAATVLALFGVDLKPMLQ